MICPRSVLPGATARTEPWAPHVQAQALSALGAVWLLQVWGTAGSARQNSLVLHLGSGSAPVCGPSPLLVGLLGGAGEGQQHAGGENTDHTRSPE